MTGPISNDSARNEDIRQPSPTAGAAHVARPTSAGVAAQPVSSVPPASTTGPANVTALAPTSGAPAAQASAAADRYAAAASGFNASTGARALFKAALEAANHDADAAWKKYQAFMAQQQTELAAQADADRAAANATMSNANTAVVCGVAGAACSVGSGYVDGAKSQKFLAGAGTGYGSLEKYASAKGQAGAETAKAGGADSGARAQEADAHKTEMDKAMQHFHDTIAQLSESLKEIGTSQIVTVKV